MVSYSPFAMLTANSVSPAKVPADKDSERNVRTAPQSRQAGRSFIETLSKAAAKIEKDIKTESVKSRFAEREDPAQTSVVQGEAQAAVMQTKDQKAAVEVDQKAVVEVGQKAVVEVGQKAVVEVDQKAAVEEDRKAVGVESAPQPVQVQGEGEVVVVQDQLVAAQSTVSVMAAQVDAEGIPFIPQGIPISLPETADLAPAKVHESPVQETGLQENNAQVTNYQSASNQTAEKKGPLSQVSPVVQQQLADLLQALENLVGVGINPVNQAAADVQGVHETSQPNQLLAENGFLTPGVSTIARFIDEQQAILGLQQVLRQELAKFQDSTEIPQNLAKIKDLINSQLDDKSPLALGELLNRLAETLEQTGLGKQKRPQADMIADGFSSDEDRVMTQTFMFESKGTRTESGRLNPDLNILRAPEGSEEGQTNLNKLPEVGKASGSAGAVVGTAGAGLEKGSSSETSTNTAVQFTSVSTTDKVEVQSQNMQFPNEAKLESRTAAYAASEAGEKQAQVNKMDFGIVNQIAQKVKLSTAPEKTEMQIQLKPEFLGKLDLIVSTENGLVTAKFNTGSNHVKAIIEANLNTLRDALAEQGVKVDQLTVTVNADRDFSGFQHREPAFQQNRFARGNKMTDKETDLEEMLLSSEKSLVSRKYHGNTVDFMA